MSDKKQFMSQEWYEKIIAEISDIEKKQIPETLEVLKDARSQWDLSENSDYHAAKEKLALLQRRLVELEWLIEGVEIVEKTWSKATTITYGSHVTLDIEWDGVVEADIVNTGEVFVGDVLKISFESPLGKILEGKKKWDELVLKLPAVNKKIKVLSVA